MHTFLLRHRKTALPAVGLALATLAGTLPAAPNASAVHYTASAAAASSQAALARFPGFAGIVDSSV